MRYLIAILPLLCYVTSVLGNDALMATVDLPDPLRPALLDNADPATGVESAASLSYELSAIKIDGGRARAIINGQMVAEGARLGAATVRKIRSRQVDLATANGTTVLRLNQYEIKHDVATVHATR